MERHRGTVSWDLCHDLLARAAPEPEHASGRWALETLKGHLGPTWPGDAAESSAGNPLLSALVSPAHTVARAETLEWALRLRAACELAGFAALRRELRTDARAARTLHTSLQLDVSSRASRLGWPVELEPGDPQPADVRVEAPSGALLVECKVLTQANRSRDEHDAWKRVEDRLTVAAARRGLRLAGTFDSTPPRGRVEAIADWISRADAGASLRVPGVAVTVLDEGDSSGRLTGPLVIDALEHRLAEKLNAKALQMRGSGAGWLWMTVLTGLWPMTGWGQLSLARKLATMVDWVRGQVAEHALEGLVMSSGAATHLARVDPGRVEVGRSVAVRHAVEPLRARETLVIPLSRNVTPAAVGDVVDLVAAEVDWRAWALDAYAVP